jgi:hypothetical protein
VRIAKLDAPAQSVAITRSDSQGRDLVAWSTSRFGGRLTLQVRMLRRGGVPMGPIRPTALVNRASEHGVCCAAAASPGRSGFVLAFAKVSGLQSAGTTVSLDALGRRIRHPFKSLIPVDANHQFQGLQLAEAGDGNRKRLLLVEVLGPDVIARPPASATQVYVERLDSRAKPLSRERFSRGVAGDTDRGPFGVSVMRSEPPQDLLVAWQYGGQIRTRRLPP